MRSLALLTILGFASACHVRQGGDEPAFALGAQNVLGYHVLAQGSTGIPGGDIGFLVTANGQGGYRVSFTDTEGSPANFNGTITCDTTFDPTQLSPFGGANAELTAPNRIDFNGVPGASLEGVDMVSQTDPIYFSGFIDGSANVDIFFTGAHTGVIQTSAYNAPVAFTSP